MGIAKHVTPTRAERYPELRAWMRRTKTSQQDLAGLLGIRPPQMSRILGGTRTLASDHAARLSELTGVPVEKLLMGARAVRLLKFLGRSQKRYTPKPKENVSVA